MLLSKLTVVHISGYQHVAHLHHNLHRTYSCPLETLERQFRVYGLVSE